MVEAATEDGKPFRILCFKYPYYVMKIMALWITLDELEGDNTRHNYKSRDGGYLVKN